MTKSQIDELMNKKPFIRNFGKIMSSVEGYFCNINCIKTNKFRENGISLSNTRVPIFNSYKRLISDGIYTKKVELGFTDKLESLINSTDLNESLHISDIITYYMSLPVDLKVIESTDENVINNEFHVNYWTTIELGKISPLLTRNYYRATVKNRKQKGKQNDVLRGEACVTLSFAESDKIILPANAEKLDSFLIEGQLVDLFGYNFSFKHVTFKVWLFKLPSLELLISSSAVNELRNRRANLFRLNAEKETVRILANRSNPGKPEARVTNYIKKTPIKIFKKQRFSTSQNDLRNFALQSGNEKVQFSIEDFKHVLDDYGLANLKALGQSMKATSQKKKILFITSNPTATNPFDYGEQFKNIENAHQKGTDREYFEKPDIKTGVERDQLSNILNTEKPDFLHISMHNSKMNGLYFQDAVKNASPMSTVEFADYIELLCGLKKPVAVILSACNSLEHSKAIKNFCDFSIGTDCVFPDLAAIIYAKKFYEALFNGQQVDFCHKFAIKCIKYEQPPFELIEQKEVYTIIQII